MFLKKLKLINFRNYAFLDLNFDDKTTVLIGNNAVGKSNLLEAIYLLSVTKSQRVETEDELIKKGEDFTRIEGSLANQDQTGLAIIINRLNEKIVFKKRLLVNRIPRRVVDFIGHLPAVIFYPADINMVTGSPSLRRWYLDLGLAQIDHDYKKALTAYEQLLIARNRVLKSIREGKGRLDELDYWTQESLEHSKIISEKRLSFFAFINKLEKPLGDFKFEYKASKVTWEKLNQGKDREIAAATTLIGPHRDDFMFFLEDRNLAHFGSRGEQRIGTLAFKLTQLEYMAKVLGTRPLLLLDDVFSELDVSHRASVVDIVSKQQTIIATVELENIPQEFLDSARIIKVENGTVIS